MSKNQGEGDKNQPFKGEGLAPIPAKIWGGTSPLLPLVPTALLTAAVD